jgi:hypothetical protein
MWCSYDVVLTVVVTCRSCGTTVLTDEVTVCATLLPVSNRSESEDNYLNYLAAIHGYCSWLQTRASRMELRCITVEVTSYVSLLSVSCTAVLSVSITVR